MIVKVLGQVINLSVYESVKYVWNPWEGKPAIYFRRGGFFKSGKYLICNDEQAAKELADAIVNAWASGITVFDADEWDRKRRKPKHGKTTQTEKKKKKLKKKLQSTHLMRMQHQKMRHQRVAKRSPAGSINRKRW